ncbi:MAG: DUF2273 domain-containing protein [Caloramator sp.]|nr:DUF2273 domain-containing protein [Caloramator sp.]
MWKEYIIDLFRNHTGKFVGSLLGLLFSIFVLVIGFFKTVFIVICIFFGYYIGKKIDNNENLLNVLQNILNTWK